VDNTLLDLQNSSYPTQPHSIIAKYNISAGSSVSVEVVNKIVFKIRQNLFPFYRFRKIGFVRKKYNIGLVVFYSAKKYDAKGFSLLYNLAFPGLLASRMFYLTFSVSYLDADDVAMVYAVPFIRILLVYQCKLFNLILGTAPMVS